MNVNKDIFENKWAQIRAQSMVWMTVVPPKVSIPLCGHEVLG